MSAVLHFPYGHVHGFLLIWISCIYARCTEKISDLFWLIHLSYKCDFFRFVGNFNCALNSWPSPPHPFMLSLCQVRKNATLHSSQIAHKYNRKRAFTCIFIYWQRLVASWFYAQFDQVAYFRFSANSHTSANRHCYRKVNEELSFIPVLDAV